MKKSIRKRIVLPVIILSLAFVLLFAFRMLYGYKKTTFDVGTREYIDESYSGKKNYASKQYQVKSGEGTQGIMTVDQKYEKIAGITTKSSKFDDDETKVRMSVEQNEALIQFEQKSGNRGKRALHLMIGVPPENFDSLYNLLISVGNVSSKQITKNDKTNEYRELNAKKVSLEKTRQSLIDLKSKGGRIDEYIQLENSIQSIDEQLQDLGISLGDFDVQNEFCTINFSMNEGYKQKISLLHRIKVSLEWTVKIYMRLIICGFFVVLFSFLLLLSIDKLKLIQRLISRNNE